VSPATSSSSSAAGSATRSDTEAAPLERLFERDDAAAGAVPLPLPPRLASRWGGALALATPLVYANFVSSVDGVVALRGRGDALDESGHVISGDSEPDRFVMGLLRAAADAVLLGAGTFRHAAGHVWDAATIAPAYAAAFAELRARLGLAARPSLVLVTASGDIDAAQPALAGGLVATSRAGAARLEGRLQPDTQLIVLGDGPLRLGALLGELRARGLARILCEGGPALAGELVAAGLVDELFVTASPRLFGRAPGDGKKSLLDGVELAGLALTLAGARRHDSHLFLRYRLR
jgi:riboflavin biosynthesis pyrimidine reductase